MQVSRGHSEIYMKTGVALYLLTKICSLLF